MAPPWTLLIVVCVFLQALGVFCYIMSQRQKKAFDAASAASGGTLTLILPLRDPSETLPPYSRNDDGVGASSPPSYDAGSSFPVAETNTPDSPGQVPISPGTPASMSVAIDLD
ncbi:unnamed protein product [Mortierella alpina]